ncbi:MAG: cysteine-S-conjugate beta-lyase, partial [Paraburkholderia sp.]|nr:cysteine-S-conjugate beta-lyase [Paraburkholderia sp.]
MTDSTSSRAMQTRIVHADADLAPGFASFTTPVVRASTVIFPDLVALRAADWRDDSQWRYGLHATPTSAE